MLRHVYKDDDHHDEVTKAHLKPVEQLEGMEVEEIEQPPEEAQRAQE